MMRKTSAAVAVVSLVTVGAAKFSGTALAGGKDGHKHHEDPANVVVVENNNTNENANTNSAAATNTVTIDILSDLLPL